MVSGTVLHVEGEGRPRRARRRWLAATLVALAGATVGLYFWDPAAHPGWTLCLFHRCTGLACPGCGGTRAFHYLLHGHLRTALRYHPLVGVIVPLIGYVVLRDVAGWREPVRLRRWWWAAAVVLGIFGVVRNLPGWPWELLRPPV